MRGTVGSTALLLTSLLVAAGPQSLPASTNGDVAYGLSVFSSHYRDAWQMARLGRVLEAHAMLLALPGRLDQLPEPHRSKCRERVARALEALGDPAAALRLRSEKAPKAKEKSRAPAPNTASGAPVTAEQATARGAELIRLARAPYVAWQTRRECYTQALGYLERVPTISSDLLYQRGLCLKGLGKEREATNALEAAARLAPQDPYPRFALAEIAWGARDRTRASALLETALSQTLDLAGTRLLASMLKDQKASGHRDEAVATCRAWLDRCGTYGAMTPLVLMLAECQEEDGQLDEAIQGYARAVPEGGAIAAGGLVRVLWAKVASGPTALAEVVKTLPSLVPPDAGVPDYLLLAAAEISLEGKAYRRSFEYIQAGLHSSTSTSFFRALQVLAGQVENFKEDEIARQIATLLEEHHLLPITAPPPSEEMAGQVFQALLKARTTGVGIEDALGLAISASMQPSRSYAAGHWYGPGRRFDSPEQLRSVKRENNGFLYPQRYSLLEPYLIGDLETTMDVLEGMVPTLPRLSPAPPAPEGTLAPTLTAAPEPIGSTTSPGEPAGSPPSDNEARSGSLPPLGELTRAIVNRQEIPAVPPAVDAMERAVARAQKSLASPQTTERERLTCLLDVARMLGSPLVIDLAGTGRLDLTPYDDASAGVFFDLGGTGAPQLIQWTAGASMGWLCEDLGGDGRITSGLELFGTAGGYANGFEKLALRDVNHDGVISGAELDGLSIWVDRNGNCRTDPGELMTGRAAGLESIVLPRAGMETTVTMHGKVHQCWDVWPRVFRIHP